MVRMHVSLRKMELDYISLGCNRAVHVLDWGGNGLVAFGGHRNLAIFYPPVRELL
jgi:hypothetical protein